MFCKLLRIKCSEWVHSLFQYNKHTSPAFGCDKIAVQFCNNLLDSPSECEDDDDDRVLSSDENSACCCFHSGVASDVCHHMWCHFDLLQNPFVQFPKVGRWGEILVFYLSWSFNAFSLSGRLYVQRKEPEVESGSLCGASEAATILNCVIEAHLCQLAHI